MRKLLIIFCLLIQSSFASELIFNRDSKSFSKMNLEDIKELGKKNFFLKVKNQKLYDPVVKANKEYTGVDFLLLMDDVYGIEWRKAYKVHFRAKDGYRVSALVKDMLSAAREKRGLLAFGEKGKRGFTPYNKGKKKVDLGPYYLVWSSFKKGDLRRLRKSLRWPYQLKSIELKTVHKE